MTVLCVTRESAQQCSPMSYNESYEASMSKRPKPWHVHLKGDGAWQESVWGPESECIRAKK